MKTDTSAVNIDRDIGDFHYKVDYGFDAGVGLNQGVVNYISDVKQDPDWVREFRLKALRTFERLGIPEQERKFLAGVEAQFDSEAVYSNIKKAVGEQGVIFVGSTEGL